MSTPSKLGEWRDARDARELCNKLGALCTGQSESIVAAAISGIVSQLDPVLQMMVMEAIQQRTVHLDLQPETTTAIDKIVKGIT